LRKTDYISTLLQVVTLFWFHGLGVYGLEKLIFPALIGLDFYLRPESIASAQHILAGIPLLPHLNNLPRAVVGAGGQQE